MSYSARDNSITKAAISSLAWQYSSVLIQVVLQILVLAILARLLSPEDFGLIGIAMIFVDFASLFAYMGVGPAIVQRRELNSIHITTGFTLSVLLSILMAIVLCIGAPYISIFFHTGNVANVLRGVSLSFLFISPGIIAESLLQKHLQFKKLMWIDISSYTTGYVFIGITLALLGYGVWALVGAILGQSFTKSVLLLLSRRHVIAFKFSTHGLKELLSFGGGFTLGRGFNLVANQIDYLVVGRQLSIEDLGFYTRAYQLMYLPAHYLGTVLDRVMFPVMVKIQTEPRRLKIAYLRSVALISLVSAPISIFIIINAPELVRILLGPKWTDVIVPLQILSLGILFRTSYKVSDSTARAMGVVYRRAVRQAVYALAVLLGAWVGSHWNLIGVSIGVLCAVILNYLLMANLSLVVVGAAWGDFIRDQFPGITLAIIIGALSAPTTIILRNSNVSSLAVLLVTFIVSVLPTVALCFLRPRILGPHGNWALIQVLRYLPWMHFGR